MPARANGPGWAWILGLVILAWACVDPHAGAAAAVAREVAGAPPPASLATDGGLDPLTALHQRELPILHAIQRVPGLALPMKAVSHLGPSTYQWALTVLIFLAVSRRLALRLAFSALVGMWLREVLALGLHSPRPYFIDDTILTFAGDARPRYGYSLPSGHALLGTAYWFLIAAEIRRRWAWMTAAGIAAAIGFSRLYLGVHYPSDVLLGTLLGLGWAWLTLRVEAGLMPWWSARSRTEQAVWILLAGTGMALSATVIQYAFAGLPATDTWISVYGVRDRLLETGHRAGGGFVGLALGLLCFRHPPLRPKAWWWCLVGFGVLAAAGKFGLKPAGDWLETRFPGQRFLIAAAQFLLLWGLAPAWLIRLGWARGPQAPGADASDRTVLPTTDVARERG